MQIVQIGQISFSDVVQVDWTDGIRMDLRVIGPFCKGRHLREKRDYVGKIPKLRYPMGKTEKQADRRGRELPGSYRRPLARLDERYRGTAPGETGALVARLQGYGDLMCLVAGAWGDCSTDLHNLVQTCAESRVEHLCRSTGRPELVEGQLSVIIGQCRRLLSSCIVRAQAQCLISRVGVIAP